MSAVGAQAHLWEAAQRHAGPSAFAGAATARAERSDRPRSTTLRYLAAALGSRSSSREAIRRVARELTLMEHGRNDPSLRANIIGGRAQAPPHLANGGLHPSAPLPLHEAEPPAGKVEAPRDLPVSDVLAAARVDAVQFSKRKQALDAQLQRSQQLLAAAAALGQGPRPPPAAEALEPAVAHLPTEVAPPQQPYVGRASAELAQRARRSASTQPAARPQQPRYEPEPEAELDADPTLMKNRTLHTRSSSGTTDWRADFLRSTLSTEILPGTWSSSNSGTPGHRSSAVEPGRRGSFASAHRGSDVGSINDGPPKGGPPRTLSALEAYRAWERNVGLEQSEQGMGEEDGQGQGSSKRLRRKKPPPPSPRYASGLPGMLKKLAELSPPTSSHLAAGAEENDEGLASDASPIESDGRSAALPGDGSRAQPQETSASPATRADLPRGQTDDDLIDRVAAEAAGPEASERELLSSQQQEYGESTPAKGHAMDLLLSGGLGKQYSAGSSRDGDGVDQQASSNDTGHYGQRPTLRSSSRTPSRTGSRLGSTASNTWLDGHQLVDAVATSSRTGWTPSSDR